MKRVTIICPGCNQNQPAIIDTYAVPETGMVIDAYVHICECGYMILESEWNEVEEAAGVDPYEIFGNWVERNGHNLDTPDGRERAIAAYALVEAVEP